MQPPVAPRTAMVCLDWTWIDIVVSLMKFSNEIEIRCFELRDLVLKAEEDA
jgi:hypothetical protein